MDSDLVDIYQTNFQVEHASHLVIQIVETSFSYERAIPQRTIMPSPLETVTMSALCDYACSSTLLLGPFALNSPLFVH